MLRRRVWIDDGDELHLETAYKIGKAWYQMAHWTQSCLGGDAIRAVVRFYLEDARLVTVSGFIPRTNCLSAMESDSPILRRSSSMMAVNPRRRGLTVKQNRDPLPLIGTGQPCTIRVRLFMERFNALCSSHTEGLAQQVSISQDHREHPEG